jgi:hypothetical protein
MQEMKHELAAYLSALSALGVEKKGGKPKPPGGALPRGLRKWFLSLGAEKVVSKPSADSLLSAEGKNSRLDLLLRSKLDYSTHQI